MAHVLDFRCLKDDRNYVELTGGDKTCTFKVLYQSEVLDRRTFLKVQMNFVEIVCYPFKSATLKSIISGYNRELVLLYPEYEMYTQKIVFDVYDCHEILAEKIRAILIRQGTKARDYIDAYLIEKQYGISLNDIYACVLEKTQFTLNLYERYRQNLEEKKHTILSTPFNWGEEKKSFAKRNRRG